MDCEKFEATMLDELYGELDELTVAASKRHVGGCARCAALIGGLRATRKIVTLPVLAPSEGFESRLLAAVDAAQAKPKLGPARVISLAGRWAMRPQTAMAAVFLLMLGTSSVLLSGRVVTKSTLSASSGFTVTENGAPASPAPTMAAFRDETAIDSRTAAAAHGTAPLAAASAAAHAAPAPEPTPGFTNGPSDREGSLAQADRTDIYSAKPRMAASKSAPRALGGLGSNGFGPAFGGGGGGGSADLKKASPPVNSLEENREQIGGDGVKQDSLGGSFAQAPPQGAARAAGPAAPAAAVPPPPPPATKDQDDDPLATARTLRDGPGGCQAAVVEYDRVASRSFGSTAGYDATLEGARCYGSLGLMDAARSRYQRLLTVPAYASRAQTGINAISQVAARARAVSHAASAAKPSAAVAPAAAPATPSTQK